MKKNYKLFLLASIILGYLQVGAVAMDPPSKEEDPKEANKGIILYLKDQDVDLRHVRVQEARYSWNPYRVVSPHSERLLKDSDLHSTAIRGFLLGFSNRIVECAEIFLHNFSFHGASQCGKQVGENYMAPSVTFVVSQIVTNLIYNCTAVANPFHFPGRALILNLMSYDMNLNGKLEGCEKDLIQQIPQQFQEPAKKVLADLRGNKFPIESYMCANVPGGAVLKKVSDCLEGEKTTKKFNLKEIASVAQLNPYDILNNGIYTGIQQLVDPLVKKTELVTSPFVSSLSQFVAEYYVENKINNINFEPIKPILNGALNACFKVRYPELEKRLDPVFCKLGKEYAQELIALSVKPIAVGFGLDPLQFVTIKSHQDLKAHSTERFLISTFEKLKNLLTTQHSAPKFIGL